MNLSSITCINFKNHQKSEMCFSPEINCITGDNGAGKTNILEAIYMLSFSKSYFNSLDRMMIKHDEQFFALHGKYKDSDDIEMLIQYLYDTEKGKQFKLNKKNYKRFSEHIGKIPLVMISPYDRDLINEGSETRRKFVDGLISQFQPLYLDTLLNYSKAVQQRNALLKQFALTHTFNSALLDEWTAKLIQYGTPLFEERRKMLTSFLPIFEEIYGTISGGNEKVSIKYESALFTQDITTLFKDTLEKDRMVRFTTQGVHKDDFTFLINGYPIKKYGSQGQQKSFVTALKLAQFEHYFQDRGKKPILLLDDIFDKLDHSRVSRIIELVGKNTFGQVFITDTQPERIDQLFKGSNINHKKFNVENGVVEVYT